jgi:hypothetical protein
MGKIKPIGSEKLEGLAKLNRIMEIARYKENIPKPINEDKSVEYTITLADGNTYRIDKERNGYVIKKGLNESTDYIEPMKNRKYYSSYSQAFKRLNLIAKEVNVNEGYDKNVSLFESEDEEMKYYLKLNSGGGETDEQAAPAPAPAPVPAPAPAPAPDPSAIPSPEGEELPEPEMGDEDMDMDMEDDMDMEEPEDDEDEVVTFKSIQKITGKLGQKIRTFLSDEENEMPSKDIKYVINSVLSALDLNNLEEEDKEDILDKLEGLGDDEEGDDMDMDMEEPEMGDEMGDEEGEELEPEVPAVPEPEMAEGFNFDDDEEDEEEDFKPRGSRRRRIHHDEMSDDESFQVEDMIESLFSESSVDRVLGKYFKPTKKLVKENVQRKETTFNKIQKLSESKSQEAASAKVLSKYPTAKLVGKTVGKDIVFEVEDKRLKVSTKGGFKLL